MNITEIFNVLKQNNTIMEFNPPASDVDVKFLNIIKNMKARLSYKSLLKCFNGGEVFIPGTTIYGLYESDSNYSLKKVNSKDLKKSMGIPNNYLIIAKLNFGDYICINQESGTIIQWDHENQNIFLQWNSLEDWFEEMIDDYFEK